MSKPVNLLLQTTIVTTADDWNIGRFSLLTQYLASLANADGQPRYHVTGRDRARPAGEDDPVLSTLDNSEFDELWLFAVDVGNGLTQNECAGITRFRQRGGGLMATRDHNDLGSSICTLGGIGKAHYFHSQQTDPDEARRCRDDNITTNIDWPNYHSGANGDYQRVEPVAPLHELLRRPDAPSGRIETFPAHPHEGGIGAPPDEPGARVIATGRSQITDRPFNLIVAFDRRHDDEGHNLGRGVAESSFHHFADYNWDITRGCPSFVEEAPGKGYQQNPAALADIKTYVSNLARWLAPGVSGGCRA